MRNQGGSRILCGVIGSPDGKEIIAATHERRVTDRHAVGIALAEPLLDAGARALLEKLRLAEP